MKNIVRVLILGTVALMASAANAAVIKYAYEARVSTVWEYDSQTSSITYLDSSDFAGTPVANGDLVQGFFQYDTSAGLSSYQPDQQPGSVFRSYNLGATNFISYLDGNTSLGFGSMPAMNWFGGIMVQDSVPVPGSYANDFLSYDAYADNEAMFSSAGMWFDDVFGNAFSDAGMPPELDLGAFQYASVDGSFVRHSDGDQMHFSADLTSLKRADVPEPSSGLLFLIAGASLFAASRKRLRG